jgi:hypothetical protein
LKYPSTVSTVAPKILRQLVQLIAAPPPSQTVPNPQTTQAKLPFTDLKDFDGVAVDTADNVYVTDYFKNRVLEPSAR